MSQNILAGGNTINNNFNIINNIMQVNCEKQQQARAMSCGVRVIDNQSPFS
jgi:hypothetical protein